ncbi:MAG: DUF362 domain-containing protein [Gemmatimonadetes bacterium]|nr:DUF362 domain-containing protein [Gemmatimonadota bacterium]
MNPVVKKPVVAFMDARSSSPDTSLVAKMLTVFDAAGLDEIISPGDVVAIKLHCGEWNNTAYLRPVYARALADRVKELGGRPFVCDTTTLPYAQFPSRVTELDLLLSAERNGFTSATLGCPFICADGFVGTSDHRVDLPEGFLLKEAYIAQAIAAADALIALTHFKGHAMGVIGGALKNLGIGAQSKRGKFNVHLGGHPKYGMGGSGKYAPEAFKGKESDPGWRAIEESCPFDLLRIDDDDRLVWDSERCTTCLGCGTLLAPRGILEMSVEMFEATDAAIADGALGAVKAVGREKVGFVNMAIDVSPGCDCPAWADTPVVPHLGVFASKDPVAIDQACVDMATAAPGVRGSRAEDMGVDEPGDVKFDLVSPLLEGLSQQTTINTAALIGLGSREYELVRPERAGNEKFAFPPDPRRNRVRFGRMFEKLQPFPYDRHGGRGFDRLPEVDFEKVHPKADVEA